MQTRINASTCTKSAISMKFLFVFVICAIFNTAYGDSGSLNNYTNGLNTGVYHNGVYYPSIGGHGLKDDSPINGTSYNPVYYEKTGASFHNLLIGLAAWNKERNVHHKKYRYSQVDSSNFDSCSLAAVDSNGTKDVTDIPCEIVNSLYQVDDLDRDHLILNPIEDVEYMCIITITAPKIVDSVNVSCENLHKKAAEIRTIDKNPALFPAPSLEIIPLVQESPTVQTPARRGNKSRKNKPNNVRVPGVNKNDPIGTNAVVTDFNDSNHNEQLLEQIKKNKEEASKYFHRKPKSH